MQRRLGDLKPGQRFRWAAPLPDEDAEQTYTVREVGVLNAQVVPDGFEDWRLPPVLTYPNREHVVPVPDIVS